MSALACCGWPARPPGRRPTGPWRELDPADAPSFIDPTLELDLYADKPWALSPVVSTMTKLRMKKGPEAADGEQADQAVIEEDALGIIPDVAHLAHDTPARRKYLADATHRAALALTPDVEVGMEFSNGILDFNTLSVQLPRPFSVSFNLLKYWDGQPVTYVCRRRSDSPADPAGVYWSVAFEIVDEDARRELEKKGKTVLESSELKDRSVAGEEEDEDNAAKAAA